MGVLWRIINYWRRKAGEAAFAAARMADKAEERDHYCRLAVMAGHRDACRMFCFSRPDLFEGHPPLKPFKSRGIRMTFYGYYYPSRYKALINDEQQEFSHSIYEFKESEIHGIEFFKACMEAMPDGRQALSYHVHAV